MYSEHGAMPADDARSESFFGEKAPKNGASRNVHLHVE
jgi:hypothetical protein